MNATSDGNNDTTSNSNHADEGSGFSVMTKKDSDTNVFVVDDSKGKMSKKISDTKYKHNCCQYDEKSARGSDEKNNNRCNIECRFIC